MRRYLAILMVGLLFSAPCVAEMLDQHARATDLSPPAYPASDKKEGRGGLVSVVVRVDEKGVAKIDRVMGTWHSLISSAKAAAATWKFTPCRRDGKPASDVLEFIVVFDPQNGVEILGPLYSG